MFSISRNQNNSITSTASMKNFYIVLILTAITFLRFGLSTKNFTKHARQVNVETCIRKTL